MGMEPGKRIYVLLADGFEDIEAIAPIDILRRADLPLATVGVTGAVVTSSHGVAVRADVRIEDLRADDVGLLLLPGGPGVSALERSPAALSLIKAAAEEEKYIAAICAAPGLLARMGLLRDRRVVCHPSVADDVRSGGARLESEKSVVADKNIITAKAAGSALAFALTLVTTLCAKDKAEHIRISIFYPKQD